MESQITPVNMTLDEAQAFAKWREEQGAALAKRKKADKYLMTNAAIRQQYDIVRVNANSTYYYRPVGGSVYERLTDHKLDNLVRDIYLSGFGSAEPKELKDAAEMTKRLTTEEVDDLNNDLWYVTPRVYWDTNLGELTDKDRKSVV